MTIHPATKADERALFVLKTKGAMTALHLAEKLGVSVVATRKQLGRLEEAGLVSYREMTEGRGRPERLWRLTAEGHDRFPDSHSDLTLELIASIRRVFGEEGLDRLITEREETARTTYGAMVEDRNGLEDRVAALARQRQREGYMAEVEKLDDGALLLIENHCPICAAATACQGFCRSELAVFRAVLGRNVRVSRTDHILAGARRCAYRIEPGGRDA
ncbi:helix-turn-helix transcriptional regulator [Chelativorans salis]|uniref:Transcriptional regulator n=1 Tax=Chelativorans salis TaxID=2978478 RepID=A0ABT2LT61_9HYPH|nr:metalloregulator ArsR/SmtB family transcription factor [Chelativorans sp. EGI FJ00035]MCT7377705.1 transcriptional regulator [Chelativorans sp. EGI FJ00035]